MLDVNPGLRSAYEQYKTAKDAKEAVLDRVDDRRTKLANMPAPFNLAINVAQLFGFEYEYRPEDMSAANRNDSLMFSSRQTIGRELSRTPGEYPLSSLWYHKNALINLATGNPQPWAIHFGTEIEGEYFATVLKAERVKAFRSEEPLVHVRIGESPSLYLPEGYRMLVCTEPDWRCQDENETCRPNEFKITNLSDKPRFIP